MAEQRIKEGDWLRVAIPPGLFPVTIQIDNQPEQPAFIDRIVERGGEIVNYAAIRLPELRHGRHVARARHEGQTFSTRFEVLR